MSTEQEVASLPELKLPFELWEMYRLSDIKERIATGEYARYSKTWGIRPSTVTEDIKFLLACIKKLSKDKAK